MTVEFAHQEKSKVYQHAVRGGARWSIISRTTVKRGDASSHGNSFLLWQIPDVLDIYINLPASVVECV